MTWISLPRGWLATMSVRKATNSAEVWRVGGLAQHLAGLGVEGRVQRQRAVAVVLEAMALGAPRRQRQHRILAVQRLDRGLLVDAEHRRVLRRVQVQPDHVGRLGLEVRVVGGQVALQPMRLEAVLGPDARHRHVRDRRRVRRRACAYDQCVEPSAGLCLVVQASTRASIRSVTL